MNFNDQLWIVVVIPWRLNYGDSESLDVQKTASKDTVSAILETNKSNR